MTTVRAFLPALGVSFVFALAAPEEKPVFAPQPGSSVTKLFTISGEFALDEISVIVDGQDLGAMLGQFAVNVKQETKIEVTDVYEAVADERPLELLRTFDTLSAAMNMDVTPAEAEMPEFESSSELEGKTVHFRWNEEKDEYDRSFPEGEEDDAELLEDLTEDMDLRVFLPSGEVGADESWTVELADLQQVIMPGGNLRFMPEGVEVDQDALKTFEELFGGFGSDLGDLLEGECTCTYKGARDVDGARVGEIAIEVEVSATLDLAEVLNKAIGIALEQQGAGDSVSFAIDKADLNLDFDGAGALLWDLGAGRMHAFQLDGDATIDVDLAMNVTAEGESHSMDASAELSGSLREEVAVKE